MASLSNLDLEKMVSAHIGIDVYTAKSGSDEDVCVISFRVRGDNVAKDLSRFLEKEGSWILDCDSSTGEDNTGKYLVFVEIRRNRRLHERIMELLDIVERLTGTLRWQFNVAKKLTVHHVKLSNLENLVAASAEDYREQKDKHKSEIMSEFFNDSPFNTVVVEGDKLHLQQYFQPHRIHSAVDFTLVNEDPQEDLDEDGGPELTNTTAIWLSKVLGPSITVQESGGNFLLTNSKMNQKILVSMNV